MNITSKLPEVGTTIFTIMSKMAADHGAINLSQGYPNFEVDPVLKDLVNHYIQSDHNQYAPMIGISELRQAIAKKKSLLYGCEIDADQEITITNGATEAIYSAISALIRSGDEVIIFEPAYDSYVPAIQVNSGIPRPIRLKSPSYKIDWQKVRRTVNDRTRMIILNTPHNPTGSIWGRDDIEELSAITKDTDILVLSDEVYQHLIYDHAQHESVLRYNDLYHRSIVTMSFGKTFHATGWRIGYVIAPPAITSEIRKVHQFNTFSINRPLQHALADYLNIPDRYLSLNNFFQRKRDLFIDAIKNSRFDLLPCHGTYFMLASYQNISDQDDQSFARWMTKECGVAVIPISSFYTDETDEHIIRFCFAKTDDLLIEASSLITKM